AAVLGDEPFVDVAPGGDVLLGGLGQPSLARPRPVRFPEPAQEVRRAQRLEAGGGGVDGGVVLAGHDLIDVGAAPGDERDAAVLDVPRLPPARQGGVGTGQRLGGVEVGVVVVVDVHRAAGV